MRLPLPLLSLLIGTALPAIARADDSRCAGAASHRDETVLVLAPSGGLTICLHGAVQDDVVTGRPVWLVLQSDADSTLYEYRLAERDRSPAPSGLAQWQENADGIARLLGQLVDSAETIEDMPPGTAVADPRLQAVVTARAMYLGVVTPPFHDAVRELAESIGELPSVAEAVERWCSHVATEKNVSPDVAARLSATCAEKGLDRAGVHRDAEALRGAIRQFHQQRTVARDALVQVEAMPADVGRQQEAIRDLDGARTAALAVIAIGERLRPAARQLAHQATLLREAVHSGGLLHAGAPVFLGRYGHAGNGILRVQARPVGIIGAGVQVADSDSHELTYRFAIVGTHYVDLEAGLGVTGGVPQVPTLGTTNGMSTIQGKSVDEFVALALVELEPARFAWPDRPLAGLLRLPVIGIPLSVNPTNNFFIGAGLGWTGIGSITGGPYLLREVTLRPGYSLNQALPAGSSFASVTQPAVQVGYYVSASVDLVGLFHLFVPVRARTIDATTGKEL